MSEPTARERAERHRKSRYEKSGYHICVECHQQWPCDAAGLWAALLAAERRVAESTKERDELRAAIDGAWATTQATLRETADDEYPPFTRPLGEPLTHEQRASIWQQWQDQGASLANLARELDAARERAEKLEAWARKAGHTEHCLGNPHFFAGKLTTEPCNCGLAAALAAPDGEG